MHAATTLDGTAEVGAGFLADAFSEFIATSARLEQSYRELQKEVEGLGYELTERNAALKASVSQNELMRLALQQIVDSMPCGVLVVEGDGTISTINPESGRLLGFAPASFAKKAPTTLKQIAARAGVHLEFPAGSQRHIDTEQEVCVRVQNEDRWLHIRRRGLFPASTTQAKSGQTILILRDITAQKRAEHDREAGRNALALAQITTMLAHEVRNPLASLELFAELIEQDEERRGEWISNLRAGIRSLSGTVNNVLTFHSSGSLKLSPVSVDMLIGNAMQFVQPVANQAGVELRSTTMESTAFVLGNQSALHQVMLNLLTNAVRHTPSGGTVTLSVQSDDRSGNVVIECADTGCGLRPDQLDHIFEPGFSGSGDTSGLGLAVCQRIIHQHGGRITASNLVPTGASFLIELTAAPGEAK
jgi:two-component system sensor histidine kinase FlrB